MRRSLSLPVTSLLFASVILLSSSLDANASCNWFSSWIGLCQGAESLGESALKAVQVLTNQVKETQDLLDRTVPGLRESTELNDLSSSDPKVRAAAAERYRQLANAADAIGTGGTKLPAYELVVAFEFDTKRTFHAAVQKAQDGTESEARLYVEQGSIELSDETTPKVVNLRPLTDVQARQELIRRADAFFQTFMGKPRTGVGHNQEHPETVNCYTYAEDRSHNPPAKPPVQSQDGYCAGLSFPDLFINKDWSDRNLRSPPDAQQALKNITAAYEAAKTDLLGQLVDVVMSAYSYKETRFANTSYSDDWNLTDIRHHVIVYVDKDSYDAQSDWTILVRVQKADNPDNSLFNRPTRKLIKDNFKSLQLSNKQTVYWAQVEMTGELSDASLKQTIENHRQTLDALAQQNENALKAVAAK